MTRRSPSTQNTAQAKQLLQQAGYGPGGKKLTLTLTHAQGDDNEALMAAILKSDLAQLNVDLKVVASQWTAQWDRAKSSDAAKRQDIFVMYWYPDYADAYSWFTNLFQLVRQAVLQPRLPRGRRAGQADRRAPAEGGRGRRRRPTRPTRTRRRR